MCEYLKMIGRPQDDPEVIAFMQKYDWKGRFQNSAGRDIITLAKRGIELQMVPEWGSRERMLPTLIMFPYKLVA